ncbi:transcriptional regulator BolA [secondary endosymbiont of Ctenarytaina eucalypti]|uniref:DNA-binding transcriptional regulator BolA n=1 Tax=secondary endosymbiont of Ctenarytaina eucalypti TaxID=1199245 RepID=J3TG36_9ENTR|nr:transcriptional regulator BolA [secondary endosymbiont of Ctenarytaina eucalypti]AFP85322.1 stress-induced morphogen [secondary endosymbiont of Ctenarytaina eucalypti]
MSMREKIEKKIRSKFAPFYLEVLDESDSHNVPVGAESHFKVVVVSDQFNTETALSRHRKIYGVLADELTGALHGLALHAYTLMEWEELKAQAPVSPTCHSDVLTTLNCIDK